MPIRVKHPIIDVLLSCRYSDGKDLIFPAVRIGIKLLVSVFYDSNEGSFQARESPKKLARFYWLESITRYSCGNGENFQPVVVGSMKKPGLSSQ